MATGDRQTRSLGLSPLADLTASRRSEVAEGCELRVLCASVAAPIGRRNVGQTGQTATFRNAQKQAGISPVIRG